VDPFTIGIGLAGLLLTGFQIYLSRKDAKEKDELQKALEAARAKEAKQQETAAREAEERPLVPSASGLHTPTLEEIQKYGAKRYGAAAVAEALTADQIEKVLLAREQTFDWPNEQLSLIIAILWGLILSDAVDHSFRNLWSLLFE
jgi:hypothetical protein